jgi:hypothetical protein
MSNLTKCGAFAQSVNSRELARRRNWEAGASKMFFRNPNILLVEDGHG